MAADSPWPVIHAERAALADDLDDLDDAQWATPSQCAGWTVHQVLGHLTATAKMTPPKFFLAMLGAGFNFQRMTAKDIARETSGTPADTLAEFRRHVNDSTHPPGPVDSWLGETIVHGEDIRRPLGIQHQYPMDAVTRVADFYQGSNLLIGAKDRVAGLALRATDASWSTGTGPEVSGPALSLLLAMTGRRAGLAELTGEGVVQLAQRMRG